MKTRVPALFSAGVLALSLTACGSEEAPEEVAEVAEAAEEEKGGGLFDLLSNLGESTAEVTNYTLDISMAMPDPDLGEIEVDMTYEIMDDPQATQVTMVMPSIGEVLAELAALGGAAPDLSAEELGTTIIILPPEGESLISNHNGLQDVDTPWARGLDDAGQLAPEDLFDLSTFPDMVGAFAEVDQIEETGSEDVDGVATTVVEGTLTQEDVDAMDAESKSAVLDFLGGDLAGAVDVSIWIAEDGFPMRMHLADDEMDMELEFSSIGTTSFEIPAEDQISDL
ncbi:hypothetical protein PWG71_13170 [Nocardiopsis sp. N85]|uniref:hypothetical protein n=1 Tax=Nocardiopsis sp. N85 TaxID=3029400 RepID=UPI00237F6661|nr:hypothetical protein [Nocardiopsis sp. N85]MDE3722343.1 hypothetical protein [Nocardiopsis sp. N85]